MTTDQDYLDNRAAEDAHFASNGHVGNYAATVRDVHGVAHCMHCEAEFTLHYTGTALDIDPICPACQKRT
jgi:hypothetical protein